MINRTHKILAVDTEKENLELIDRLLSENYQVLLAESGNQALEIIQKEKNISCIITENDLPDMSGIDLLSRMSEENPETIKILLSANINTNLLIDAVNVAKINSFIIKPFNPSFLTNNINEAIRYYEMSLQKREAVYRLEKQNKDLVKEVAKYKIYNQNIVDKEKLKVLKTFSHRINENSSKTLKNIQGFAKIIKNKYNSIDPNISKYTQMIESNVNEVLDYTDELKDIGEYRLPLKYEKIDIYNFLLDLFRKTVEDIKKKDIKLITDIKYNGELLVDQTRLLRAFKNIILNSIKTSEKQGAIVVGVTKENGSIVFSFADNGNKLDAKEIKEALTPLTRPEKLATGLFEIKKIIESHNGEFELTNNEPTGKTFLVKIPSGVR